MVPEKVQVSLPSYNSDQNFDLNQFSIQAFVLRSGSRQVEGVSNTRVNSDEDPLHLVAFVCHEAKRCILHLGKRLSWDSSIEM